MRTARHNAQPAGPVTDLGKSNRSSSDSAHPVTRSTPSLGNQAMLRRISSSAAVVRRDTPAPDAAKPAAPAAPAASAGPAPAPDAAGKTDDVKVTIPWSDILSGKTTLLSFLSVPPQPDAGSPAPAAPPAAAAPAAAPKGPTAGASPAPSGRSCCAHGRRQSSRAVAVVDQRFRYPQPRPPSRLSRSEDRGRRGSLCPAAIDTDRRAHQLLDDRQAHPRRINWTRASWWASAGVCSLPTLRRTWRPKLPRV